MRLCLAFFGVLLGLGIVVASGGGEKTPNRSEPKSASPTVATVAAGYQNFRKMTKKPVYVDPGFFTACRRPSKEMVARARQKSGPHTQSIILVYMNEYAATAFEGGSKVYPVGSTIVKQKALRGNRKANTGKQAKLVNTGVGGMIKRTAGFDPKNGDWEYFYYEDPAKIESGKMQSCIKCHRGAKTSDFVFGSWNLPASK